MNDAHRTENLMAQLNGLAIVIDKTDNKYELINISNSLVHLWDHHLTHTADF